MTLPKLPTISEIFDSDHTPILSRRRVINRQKYKQTTISWLLQDYFKNLKLTRLKKLETKENIFCRQILNTLQLKEEAQII